MEDRAFAHYVEFIDVEQEVANFIVLRDRGDNETVQGAQGGGLDDSGNDRLASKETLLNYLPRESRYMVRRMLSLDPASRPTVDEVLGGEWLEGIQ